MPFCFSPGRTAHRWNTLGGKLRPVVGAIASRKKVCVTHRQQLLPDCQPVGCFLRPYAFSIRRFISVSLKCWVKALPNFSNSVTAEIGSFGNSAIFCMNEEFWPGQGISQWDRANHLPVKNQLGNFATVRILLTIPSGQRNFIV